MCGVCALASAAALLVLLVGFKTHPGVKATSQSVSTTPYGTVHGDGRSAPDNDVTALVHRAADADALAPPAMYRSKADRSTTMARHQRRQHDGQLETEPVWSTGRKNDDAGEHPAAVLDGGAVKPQTEGQTILWPGASRISGVGRLGVSLGPSRNGYKPRKRRRQGHRYIPISLPNPRYIFRQMAQLIRKVHNSNRSLVKEMAKSFRGQRRRHRKIPRTDTYSAGRGHEKLLSDGLWYSKGSSNRQTRYHKDGAPNESYSSVQEHANYLGPNPDHQNQAKTHGVLPTGDSTVKEYESHEPAADFGELSSVARSSMAAHKAPLHYPSAISGLHDLSASEAASTPSDADSLVTASASASSASSKLPLERAHSRLSSPLSVVQMHRTEIGMAPVDQVPAPRSSATFETEHSSYPKTAPTPFSARVAKLREDDDHFSLKMADVIKTTSPKDHGHGSSTTLRLRGKQASVEGYGSWDSLEQLYSRRRRSVRGQSRRRFRRTAEPKLRAKIGSQSSGGLHPWLRRQAGEHRWSPRLRTPASVWAWRPSQAAAVSRRVAKLQPALPPRALSPPITSVPPQAPRLSVSLWVSPRSATKSSAAPQSSPPNTSFVESVFNETRAIQNTTFEREPDITATKLFLLTQADASKTSGSESVYTDVNPALYKSPFPATSRTEEAFEDARTAAGLRFPAAVTSADISEPQSFPAHKSEVGSHILLRKNWTAHPFVKSSSSAKAGSNNLRESFDELLTGDSASHSSGAWAAKEKTSKFSLERFNSGPEPVSSRNGTLREGRNDTGHKPTGGFTHRYVRKVGNMGEDRQIFTTKLNSLDDAKTLNGSMNDSVNPDEVGASQKGSFFGNRGNSEKLLRKMFRPFGDEEKQKYFIHNPANPDEFGPPKKESFIDNIQNEFGPPRPYSVQHYRKEKNNISREQLHAPSKQEEFDPRYRATSDMWRSPITLSSEQATRDRHFRQDSDKANNKKTPREISDAKTGLGTDLQTNRSETEDSIARDGHIKHDFETAFLPEAYKRVIPDTNFKALGRGTYHTKWKQSQIGSKTSKGNKLTLGQTRITNGAGKVSELNHEVGSFIDEEKNMKQKPIFTSNQNESTKLYDNSHQIQKQGHNLPEIKEEDSAEHKIDTEISNSEDDTRKRTEKWSSFQSGLDQPAIFTDKYDYEPPANDDPKRYRIGYGYNTFRRLSHVLGSEERLHDDVIRPRADADTAVWTLGDVVISAQARDSKNSSQPVRTAGVGSVGRNTANATRLALPLGNTYRGSNQDRKSSDVRGEDDQGRVKGNKIDGRNVSQDNLKVFNDQETSLLLTTGAVGVGVDKNAVLYRTVPSAAKFVRASAAAISSPDSTYSALHLPPTPDPRLFRLGWQLRQERYRDHSSA